jgi:hypothetical protein
MHTVIETHMSYVPCEYKPPTKECRGEALVITDSLAPKGATSHQWYNSLLYVFHESCPHMTISTCVCVDSETYFAYSNDKTTYDLVIVAVQTRISDENLNVAKRAVNERGSFVVVSTHENDFSSYFHGVEDSSTHMQRLQLKAYRVEYKKTETNDPLSDTFRAPAIVLSNPKLVYCYEEQEKTPLFFWTHRFRNEECACRMFKDDEDDDWLCCDYKNSTAYKESPNRTRVFEKPKEVNWASNLLLVVLLRLALK